MSVAHRSPPTGHAMNAQFSEMVDMYNAWRLDFTPKRRKSLKLPSGFDSIPSNCAEKIFTFMRVKELFCLQPCGRKLYAAIRRSFSIPRHIIIDESVTSFAALQLLIRISRHGVCIHSLTMDSSCRDTVFSLALANGVSCVASTLLHYASSTKISRTYQRCVALLDAAREGKSKVVAALLKEPDIVVNIRNAFGVTPLIEAAQFGRRRVVNILLRDERVQVNAKDSNGRTALMAAVQNECDDVVEALLQDGRASVNEKDNSGVTPLIEAVQYGHEDIVSILLKDKRVDLTIRDNDNLTALMHAVEQGEREIACILLRDHRAQSFVKRVRR